MQRCIVTINGLEQFPQAGVMQLREPGCDFSSTSHHLMLRPVCSSGCCRREEVGRWDHCRLYVVSDRGGSRWRSMERMHAGLLRQSRDVVGTCSKRSAGALSCVFGRGSVRAVTLILNRSALLMPQQVCRAPGRQWVPDVPPEIIPRLFPVSFLSSVVSPAPQQQQMGR